MPTFGYEEQYLTLCSKVLAEGTYTEDRTGTGTYSLIGEVMKIDLSKGFPVLTTKKINPILPIGEMLWMLSGNIDLISLREYQNKLEGSHTIWSDDYNKFVSKCISEDSERWNGSNLPDQCRGESLGNIYGKQLRRFSRGFDHCQDEIVHDQLKTLIDNIKAVRDKPSHPMGRRLICSFWNPYDHTIGDKVTCALPACHTDFQCIVRNGKLNIRFSMRSNDVFLGLPFNITAYSFLCQVLAKLTGLEAGELVYFGTDVHIYSNHIEQVSLQLSREPRILPELVLPEFSTLDELLSLTGEDFKLVGYEPHGFIKAPQAS